MKHLRLHPATIAALAFAAFIIPMSMALAQGSLVPCAGVDCQACYVAKLIQNIIHFVIILSIPLSSVLFAVAGVMYLTAGGDTGKISRATGIFRRVAIGFLLVISGWLVVNTILTTIVNKSYIAEGSWFSIQCVDESQRPKSATINELLGTLTKTPENPYAAGNKCPSERPNLQPETGQCCKPDWTECQSPPQVDSSCTPDYPKYNQEKKQCCKSESSAECTAPQPDTQCTTDYPKYNTSLTPPKCCKLVNGQVSNTECKDPTQGGGKFTGKEEQRPHASGWLNSLLSCMEQKVPSGVGRISSISDDTIVSGAHTWEYCRTKGQGGGCAHVVNSKHYGSPGDDHSYAVDFGDEENADKLISAAKECGAYGQIHNGNHVHVQ